MLVWRMGGQLSPEVVQAALARLMATPGFAGAERMRRFIRFVVERMLAGEGETLKEYLIGVEVFDRGTTFDPRTDTIVRVEAGRLRRKLKEHYEGEGKLDPVRISLPHGSYRPVFEARGAGTGLPTVAVAGAPDSRPAPLASIAVLSFLDLSPEKDHEYLCDGCAEELINALSSVPALKVAARTSAFRFRGKEDDIRHIGASLGVEHVVEGSVRTSGDQIRVTVQLVRATDGYHVWSRQFDRPFVETFALQEEIARAVAASIGAELQGGGHFTRTDVPEACRRYLEGRHYWRKFQPQATAEAIRCFEEAVRFDSSFAPAYAGLAESWMQMSVYGAARPRELMEKARAAASRALSLDPLSTEAETVLGEISAFRDWDWETSEHHFRRALELRPNYAEARWLFATVCLSPQGRLDEALSEVRRAVDADPLSPVTHTMLGAVYFYRRQFDDAIAALESALRLDASYGQASLFMGFVDVARDRLDLAALRQDQSPYRLYVQAKAGHRSSAQAEVENLVRAGGSPLAIAAGYAGLGEIEKSLDWLEKAAELRVPQLIWMDFQGHWESLRGTDRYRAIRARMRLLTG